MVDREFMEMAIEQARKSRCREYDPKVGAVVCRKDNLIATGYRGEGGDGTHAEAAAFAKIAPDVAMDSTVFTTLEPCTSRKERQPCTSLLVSRNVGRVVIGMLDPNCDIRGEGEWQLEDARIEIGKFDPDLVQVIRGLNLDFIDYQRGLGIHISYPKAGETIAKGPVELSGSYRMHPRPGDRIVVFNRWSTLYFPQAPISYDSDSRSWTCRAHPGPDHREQEFVVARISEDLAIAQRHYSSVHKETNRWFGLDMPTLPPGFEVLDSVEVIVSI
jgi:pyrimidine deaminase RibD-like protein